MSDFDSELHDLLNRHRMANVSNTPDWILAQYLRACLFALDTAVQQRETWHGRDARPSGPTEIKQEANPMSDTPLSDAIDDSIPLCSTEFPIALLKVARRLERDRARLADALKRIEKWNEFPRVADGMSPGGTISYSMVYGSNGERDYMRDVARAALTSLEETMSNEIGYEAGEPLTVPDFHSKYHDGNIRLSEWLPNYEEHFNELAYLVLTGTHDQAEKFALSLLDKAEDLWGKG